MKRLTAYVKANERQIVKPLPLLLCGELQRNYQEVGRNIEHIKLAMPHGDGAITNAQNDVGMSFDECLQLQQAIQNDISGIGKISGSWKDDSIYGDKTLKKAYSEFKDSGHVLDILTRTESEGWVLGECKFAIRLFTSKMFMGQKTFHDSIEIKFRDVIHVLDGDNEAHSSERLIFVLTENYQQCRRQFENLRLGNAKYPIAKETYRLKTIDNL